MPRRLSYCLPILLCLTVSVRAGELKVGPPPEALRKELKLADSYKKCVVIGGFAVVGSAKVSDYAMLEAAYVVDKMLAGRDDLRKALIKNKVRLAVMAATEMTCDVPEHSDLTPSAYWNKRARGLGATKRRPAVSCAEENLLNYNGDPYRGECILVHEFGHAIHEMAMNTVDKDFDARLKTAYEQAMRDGLWKNTYAATNYKEYWAEGVQDWFDCNLTNAHEHNHVGTREALQKYDPRLAKLMVEVFKDNDWRYTRPAQRKEAGHLAGYDRSKAPRFAWPKDVLEAWQRYQDEKKPKKPAQEEKR
jgi:hypothetical protein